MKIGIIVYSQTGNTLKVCENLRTGLEEEGRSVAIERIEISGNPHRDASEFKITESPDLQKYEAVVFAAPVQGFSLARPMQKYMKTLSGLNGKKTAFIVTKGLPFKWTGGNQALSEMQKLARDTGADVALEGTVIRPGKNVQEDTMTAAEKLKKVFI